MTTMNYQTKNRYRCATLATALAWLATTGVLAIDPDLPFSSGSTGADGPLTFLQIPPGRNSHAMAFDETRQEIVLFGGYNGAGLGDTWTWRGTNWVQKLPAASPPDRWGHGLAWDANHGQVVMFGGTRSTGRLNDTWTWDGTNWTQRVPATSPGPRDGFAMAYDAARKQVVIFGGNQGGQETWLWDGTNWSQANPFNKPPGSASSSMVYDAARQEIVLFGNYGQTWIWNGTDWTQRSSLNVPSGRNFPAMAYDPVRQEVVMFSGNNYQETWVWNGVNWTQRSPAHSPVGHQYHEMVWDAAHQQIVMFGGDAYTVDNYDADTWFWNGTDWAFWSGKVQTFDLAAHANGIWNFTTIDVPSRVTVRFKKNAGNTPVRWLASGDVTVNGTIDASGGFGDNNLPPGVAASGGPGGFDGGRGGIRFDAAATYVGSAGQGPGGGAPGTAQQTSPQNLRDGQDGSFNGVYGNAFEQPLVGGSGGGGGASNDNTNGGNGGGGGGAILIASSRDITLNGVIRANGGGRQWSGASQGGRGSGGGVLLRADRVSGPGSLEAYGGDSNNPNGRIRVEAYARTLTGGQNPIAVVGLPAANGELNQVGTLTITSVAGQNVVQPPTGNPQTPDVIFSQAGSIAVQITGVGIPDNTPVKLRINTGNSVIVAGPANMVGGAVTINATVPKGVGTLQATAEFTQ